MNVLRKNFLNKRTVILSLALLLTIGVAGTIYTLIHNDTPKDNANSSNLTRRSSPPPYLVDSVGEAPPSALNPQASSSSEQSTPQNSTSEEVEPTPQPEGITVVSYEQVPSEGNKDVDCKVTYSDGTTYQWSWSTVKEQGSWVTDSSGNNGHWVPATFMSGYCDQSLLGKVKS
jgi:hypothetical protein